MFRGSRSQNGSVCPFVHQLLVGTGQEGGSGVCMKHTPTLLLRLPLSAAVARRAVITLVSALQGATPPPARGGGHP